MRESQGFNLMELKRRIRASPTSIEPKISIGRRKEGPPRLLRTYQLASEKQAAHVIDDTTQHKRHPYVEHGKYRGPFCRANLAVGGRHACRAGHVEREGEDEREGLRRRDRKGQSIAEVSCNHRCTGCRTDQRGIGRSRADEER